MADYIAKLGMKVETDGAAKASSDLDRVSASSEKATASAKRLSTQATTTGKATGALGHKAGQAGYQVADLAVQLEMGTPFLRAFGQQASQLLSVFGPAGILAGTIVAVGAAIGNVVMSMKGSVNVVQDIKNKIDELNGSVGNLSDAFRAQGINQATVALGQYERELWDVQGTLNEIATDGMIRRMYSPEEIKDLEVNAETLVSLIHDTNARIYALREQGTTPKGYKTEAQLAEEGVKALTKAEDDAETLRQYRVAALIKHNQIMEGIRAATLANGQAEDAALIALHDGQRAYELEQERNYYANAAADYVQFLTNKKEASQDHVDSIDDTENAQLQRRADAYTGFLTRRAVETESFWEDQKNQYQDDTSAAIKAEQDKLDAKAALSNAFQTLMTSESRALFEIGKAGAISETIVNTQVAAMKAFSQLGVFGAPAAAAIVAAGAVRIGKIASTQFGSRSMGSDTVPNIPTSAGQGGNTQQVSINITGGSFGAGAGDDVINSLRDFFSRDGVLFDGASTQGQVIANG